jgi:site-specific DNA-methyltransferase (adenine-specific)
MITLIQGDCLEKMRDIPDGTVDAIICDLPYGTTACKWDTVIPFEPLWEQYKRVIKPNGAIVLFGSQPFTSALVMSNQKKFKYEWVWDKVIPRGHLVAKKRPMQQTESAVVFGSGLLKYNPQMTLRD